MRVQTGTPVDPWGRLMRAALVGDDAAYRRLLDELTGIFRAVARNKLSRIGKGNSDIEDIVQEALLAIHLKRDTWDAARPFRPWAMAVLAHKISDRMRHARIRDHDVLDETFDIAAPEPDISAAADVERILDQLETPQRRIVTAISLEGRSAAEVASEIGSTEGAVRVALHRALKRLALLYREDRS